MNLRPHGIDRSHKDWLRLLRGLRRVLSACGGPLHLPRPPGGGGPGHLVPADDNCHDDVRSKKVQEEQQRRFGLALFSYISMLYICSV